MPARPPLYGMVVVFLAMAIVGVTAYFHLGWWSIIGYAIAAVIAAGRICHGIVRLVVTTRRTMGA